MSFDHYSVMLRETIDGLNIKPDGIYVDCTLGGAGHASYLLSQLSSKGHLFAFDQDHHAIENAKVVLSDEIAKGKVTFIHDNFCNLIDNLAVYGVKQVDGIYYDFGVSSPQLDVAERGFSYQKDAPLDMRMDQRNEQTAYHIVNEWTYEQLVKCIYQYGEEKFAKRIARAIEQQRKINPIQTTGELAEIVKQAIPAATRRTGGHPAKRTFQALRIAVNDELGVIETSLTQATSVLKVGARMSVISFHSLEDRLVKQYFKQLSTPPETPRNLPILTDEVTADFRLITRKPILASSEELENNNRSRSAKLRIIEKVKE